MSPQTRSRLAKSVALITVAVGVWLIVSSRRAGVVPPETETPAAPDLAVARETKPDPAAPVALPLTVLMAAPFAQEFGQEGTTPARELELLQIAFGDYLNFVKERNRKPFGYHEELIALLVGENPLRVAPIPPGHPRIDPEGRLTDRWGTPFDIHPLASTAIEIRSAGPDREMHTEDDLHNLTSSGQDIINAMQAVAETTAEAGTGSAEKKQEGGGR